jgi:hypothetical protein
MHVWHRRPRRCLLFFSQFLIPGLPAIGDLRQEFPGPFDVSLGPDMKSSCPDLNDPRSRQLLGFDVATQGPRIDPEISSSLIGGELRHFHNTIADRKANVKRNLSKKQTHQPPVILSGPEGANATEGESKDPENASVENAVTGSSLRGSQCYALFHATLMEGKCGFGDSPSRKLPETAWQRTPPRGPSTAPLVAPLLRACSG